jgi:hypothetical protein
MSQPNSNPMNDVAELAAFRPVPRTGVIYVTVEAQKRGFRLDAPGWCNLGQGQPDTGELPGATSGRVSQTRGSFRARLNG